MSLSVAVSSELAKPNCFVGRHIGPGQSARQHMLDKLGYASLDDLIDAAVPSTIRLPSCQSLRLPAGRSEQDVLDALRKIARCNQTHIQMIGMGYHDTITPPVLRRTMLESPAWYTAYTPYQPEISQGRLEALLTFQTMVSELTALPVSGASLLDEATAVMEAVLLMRRANRSAPGNQVIIDADCLPQTLNVVRGRAAAVGIDVLVVDLARAIPEDVWETGVFGVVTQFPGVSGAVRDLAPLIDTAHAHGAQVTVAADLLALTLLRPPGEFGADIAVGSTQRFGVPLFFGGPHAAYMAVRSGLERMLPGRLVGVSIDATGRPAYRLALQTREQHIRREKATSNICTAQALLANVAAMYAVYHGPQGLRDIASRAHQMASSLAQSLRAQRYEVVHEVFFDTILVWVPGMARAMVDAADKDGINIRFVDDSHVGIACDETTSDDTLSTLLAVFGSGRIHSGRASHLPAAVVRQSDFMTQPVFNSYESETAMLRFLRHLSDKDLALDRSMIPLGSCTMKLNATAEMEPISWPGFASLHPYAPAAQTAGYRQLIDDLSTWLCEITGYDRISLQPNAGSQGELAGLLAIKAYHESRGEPERTVCLIPQSAHGTNAASAVLAGMQVRVVATAGDGSIDLEDLRAKLGSDGKSVAAIMLTYPSTHGVYEEGVIEVCDLVHRAGGQVYIDGANMNALVGLAKPGQFGGDVSHLNLHKTFCIPHGGGGPGVGPVAVRAHLAPFLPGDPLADDGDSQSAVAAAQYGSAGILPITWAYLALMGPEGLTDATRTAVLSANYVAAALSDHYPTLYTGPGGLVAHECILDLRALTKATGVTAEDVAKRLIDYGFHAPTLSFPVNGTLMVEPTESENLDELDRFIEAMIAIRGEIDDVAAGRWAVADSPLRQAPHTAELLTADTWELPYSRQQAAYPVDSLRANKYWPPTRRIDGVHGDRNLVCSCPSPESFATTAKESRP
ncbi:aminomethyl-transferring glycine dehydrogenase [Gordonia sp. C13]|uniref:aminomethyl-transferring glycine dehydrogenase n=1 Tax=Gordonia sp. C13 TaxID=2935078 RepID=UPI00200AB48E|nr:aminomethyl-transferring glycine dehydrogenase [Gordonia sp. C13]MCK8615303.1 aminomethyl-transferring glycine dehydrogenase [Gordonia sp. C13]